MVPNSGRQCFSFQCWQLDLLHLSIEACVWLMLDHMLLAAEVMVTVAHVA